MKDEKKTKAELTEELARLRRLVAELEAAEAERAPAAEALRESEENYRALQVNVPAGIFRSTVEAGGRLLSVNVALAKMLGYDAPEDTAGARVADFYFRAEDRRKLMEKITSAGTVSGYEVELRRADGTTFWGAVSARGVRGDDGEIAYFDGVV